jgi:hypothetical protein
LDLTDFKPFEPHQSRKRLSQKKKILDPIARAKSVSKELKDQRDAAKFLNSQRGG